MIKIGLLQNMFRAFSENIPLSAISANIIRNRDYACRPLPPDLFNVRMRFMSTIFISQRKDRENKYNVPPVSLETIEIPGA